MHNRQASNEEVRQLKDEKRTARPRGTDSAKVIQVIETRAIMGAGERGDPVREVVQYWSFDGEMLAEYDPTRDIETDYLETGG